MSNTMESTKQAAVRALVDAGFTDVEAHSQERLSSDPEGDDPTLVIEEVAVGGIRPDGEQWRIGLSARPYALGGQRHEWDNQLVYDKLNQAAVAHLAALAEGGKEQAP